MDICVMVYWGRVSDDCFETAVKTFRKVSNALLQVYTDDIPEMDYDIQWRQVPKEQVEQRRCLAKIECVKDAVHRAKTGDRIIVSDIDVYFLDDPFSAFDKCEFDVGLTTRLHDYKFPINGGLFFINVNDYSRVIFGKQADKYIKKHSDTIDWFIDQDYLCYLWENSKDRLSGVVADVGWEYNFCPNTDVFGVKLAVNMIKRAYESRSVKVLHLKSELKLAIYDGYMEDAVTHRLDSGWNWQNDGK